MTRTSDRIRHDLKAIGMLAAACFAISAGTAGALPSPTEGEMRVARIGFELTRSNLAFCKKKGMVTGLLLHDLASYSLADRPAIQRIYGLGDGVGIRWAVPGSPGAAAGLESGDEILAVNGTPLHDLPLPEVSKDASFDRIAAFTKWLERALADRPATLLLRRNGQETHATLPQQAACQAHFAVLPGNTADAWSDGNYAAVTPGLITLADDDELAFALAHELAHIISGHAGKSGRVLARFGIGTGEIRREEAAADHLAVQLMANARYDPAGGERLLSALKKEQGLSIDVTHPAFSKRIEAIRKEIAQQNNRP